MPEVARLLGLEVPPPPTSAESGENGPGQDSSTAIRSAVGSTARREMPPFGEELTEEEQLVTAHFCSMITNSVSGGVY
jgi:hypothetical protein